MAIDIALRFVHYANHRLWTLTLPWLKRLDLDLQRPESKALQVALAAIFYFGSILVSATLNWKWVAVFYAIQTLLDMYVSPRKIGQRWDEIMGSGLNFGLAIRASLFVIAGFYGGSILQTIQGVFLASSLFFKQDLDQYDWVAYAQPWQDSLLRRLSSAKAVFQEAWSSSGRRKQSLADIEDTKPISRRLDFGSVDFPQVSNSSLFPLHSAASFLPEQESGARVLLDESFDSIVC